jgi:hypothetical protein
MNSGTKQHGGKRDNSGRKSAAEKNALINFRIPESDKEALKVKYPDLSKRFKEWYKTLLG